MQCCLAFQSRYRVRSTPTKISSTATNSPRRSFAGTTSSCGALAGPKSRRRRGPTVRLSAEPTTAKSTYGTPTNCCPRTARGSRGIDTDSTSTTGSWRLSTSTRFKRICSPAELATARSSSGI